MLLDPAAHPIDADGCPAGPVALPDYPSARRTSARHRPRFRSAHRPGLGALRVLWAPCDAVYEDDDEIVPTPAVRQELAGLIDDLVYRGAREIKIWMGRSTPNAFKRAELLDDHLQAHPFGAVISIGITDAIDGIAVAH